MEKFPQKSLPHKCFSKDIPLVLFATTLIGIMLYLLFLALYVRSAALPAWELNHKWNRLTMGLGDQSFCLSDRDTTELYSHCTPPTENHTLLQQITFTAKARVQLDDSLLPKEGNITVYSCFDRQLVANDIDALSTAKNTYFSISLTLSATHNDDVEMCVAVTSMDKLVTKHFQKLDTSPYPSKCHISLPTDTSLRLLPTALLSNASGCDRVRLEPVLQPSNNWELSRIFKDAFPLVNLALTQQNKFLAAKHLVIMSLFLLLTVLVGSLICFVRSYASVFCKSCYSLKSII